MLDLAFAGQAVGRKDGYKVEERGDKTRNL